MRGKIGQRFVDRNRQCEKFLEIFVVQQRTHIMPIVEHAKLALDQDPDKDRVPTGCLTTYHEWPGLDPVSYTHLTLPTNREV